MTSKALCVGSIAYDYIMEIFPRIREEIPLVHGNIDALNMSFVSPSTIVQRGGTAGNISFGIGYLGSPAVAFSSVGRDFQAEYGTLLENLGVELAVETYDEELTAHSYQIMDADKEQIIIWQPNATRHLHEISAKEAAKEAKVAIFSPGSAESTLRHMQEVRQTNPDCYLIFDPGQMVMTYTVKQFTDALRLADMVIMNDAEVLKARNRGLVKETILEVYPKLALVETLGSKGARFYMPDEVVWDVGIVPYAQMVEPTGAGDAFRSGMIHAYLNGADWPEAGRVGAALASTCIEMQGAQGYEAIDKKAVTKRAKDVIVKQVA